MRNCVKCWQGHTERTWGSLVLAGLRAHETRKTSPLPVFAGFAQCLKKQPTGRGIANLLVCLDSTSHSARSLGEKATESVLFEAAKVHFQSYFSENCAGLGSSPLPFRGGSPLKLRSVCCRLEKGTESVLFEAAKVHFQSFFLKIVQVSALPRSPSGAVLP